VCVLDVEQLFGCSGSTQVGLITSGCADRGILKAKGIVGGYCPGGFDHSAGSALSLFSVDDVVISCPSGPTSVPAILHMVLEGSISASAPQNWTAQVLVTINFPGVAASGP